MIAMKICNNDTIDINNDLLNCVIDDHIIKIKDDISKYDLSPCKPKVLIIFPNSEDDASSIYVRNKSNEMKDVGIDVEVDRTNHSLESVLTSIDIGNMDETVTSIVVQLPLPPHLKGHTRIILDRVSPDKDVDRLSSHYAYNMELDNLPITSKVMFNILQSLDLIIRDSMQDYKYDGISDTPILLIGNGLTTNKRLFMKLVDLGYNVKIHNSKTNNHIRHDDLIFSRIIISATGLVESLSLYNNIHRDVFVISPTIGRNAEGKGVTDLNKAVPGKNDTFLETIHHHNTYGKIGRMTVYTMMKRVIDDSISRMMKGVTNG
ncbi:MAG: tetrahydrofolate dehydrogenase/cyclohydrolase catalytic domain-containing protein [Fusobacteriaceae bacterium]